MIPAAKSAAFVCQMECVLDLYEQPCDVDYPVVCLDESPKQLLERQKFTASNGARCHDSEYVRRGVAELFVATGPLRGWRELTVEDDHSAATWVRFVARLMDTTYRTAKKGRWVMDNLTTHKVRFFYDHFPPDVAQAYLRRLEIVYTPVHGSWLNMAEIEFAVLSRQVLNRAFADKAAVQVAVARWKNQQNAAPKPRKWQFKTADARIKLVKLYPTI